MQSIISFFWSRGQSFNLACPDSFRSLCEIATEAKIRRLDGKAHVSAKRSIMSCTKKKERERERRREKRSRRWNKEDKRKLGLRRDFLGLSRLVFSRRFHVVSLERLSRRVCCWRIIRAFCPANAPEQRVDGGGKSEKRSRRCEESLPIYLGGRAGKKAEISMSRISWISHRVIKCVKEYT